MPWYPCANCGCPPAGWIACGDATHTLYLPPVLYGVFGIAGGACPCVNELDGWAPPLTWDGSIGAPTWQSNKGQGGGGGGWLYNVCTNRSTQPAPIYPGTYHTSYRMSVSCVQGGILLSVEAYTAYEPSETGYACSPGGLFTQTFPYGTFDPAAPTWTLGGMTLQPWYIAGTTPCPCAGRALTYTVSYSAKASPLADGAHVSLCPFRADLWFWSAILAGQVIDSGSESTEADARQAAAEALAAEDLGGLIRVN